MRPSDRAQARKQLDKRLDALRSSDALARPPRGWIKAIREALGMTTAQFAGRMGFSQPRAVEVERGEKEGAITLDTLERAAHALDCKLVYAFVPRKPLQELVLERARRVARRRLSVTGHHMVLEAQSVSHEDEKEQFEQLVRQIAEKAGSELWKESHE
ncbi:MAG: mobile mystery protein A [Pseudohongiellaceae bacterium]